MRVLQNSECPEVRKGIQYRTLDRGHPERSEVSRQRSAAGGRVFCGRLFALLWMRGKSLARAKNKNSLILKIHEHERMPLQGSYYKLKHITRINSVVIIRSGVPILPYTVRRENTPFNIPTVAVCGSYLLLGLRTP